MKIVKSTQCVESTKSTGKQWLARITKKRWVAVVSLSLCFVFCMSFGLSSVLQNDNKMPDRSVYFESSQIKNLLIAGVDDGFWVDDSVLSDELVLQKAKELSAQNGFDASKIDQIKELSDFGGYNYIWSSVIGFAVCY